MRTILYRRQINLRRLDAALRDALSSKIVGVSTYGGGDFGVHVTEAVTAQDEATIGAIIAAHDPAPFPTPIRSWAQAYLDNRPILLRMTKAFDDAVNSLNIADIPASLNTALQAVLTEFYKAPPGILTWMRKYRALMGVAAGVADPIDPVTLTDAQKRQLLSLLRDFAANGLATIATFNDLIE